jgi:hypothetical protein
MAEMTISLSTFLEDAGAATATTETLPPTHGANATASPLAVKLESVTSRAIDKIDQILALPLDREDACFGNVLRAQTAAANTALSTQAKVDEQRLREPKGGADTLNRLLKMIAEVEARRPASREIEG